MKDLYINVKPEMDSTGNIILDSGNQLVCRNAAPEIRDGVDLISLMPNTMLMGGSIVNLEAFINIPASNWAVGSPAKQLKLPLNNEVFLEGFGPGESRVVKINIVAKGQNFVSGTVIKQGDIVAILQVKKIFLVGLGSYDQRSLYWYLYASDDLIIPSSSCDVSTRRINVDMGDYPVDKSEKNIDLSVTCAKKQNLKFSLKGITDSETIFSNISTANPASGVGIEITRNGKPLSANDDVSIGDVGTSFLPLELKARYAENGDKIKPGNVEALIVLDFKYN